MKNYSLKKFLFLFHQLKENLIIECNSYYNFKFLNLNVESYKLIDCMWLNIKIFNKLYISNCHGIVELPRYYPVLSIFLIVHGFFTKLSYFLLDSLLAELTSSSID